MYAVFSEAESEHIQAVGCAFGEDDFFFGVGAYEISRFFPCLFVLLCGYLAEVMHSSVDIGVSMQVGIGECIELAKTEKAEDCLAWLEQQSFGQ